MERKQGPFYRIRWFLNIVKHGLFWHGVRNRLARIGLDFMPYYWVIEGQDEIEEPKIRGEQSNFTLLFLSESDINAVKEQIIGIGHKDLLGYFKEGQLCLGLKQDNNIAAYMFAKTDFFIFRKKRFDFAPNEAYLHGMYTFENYRGKNLAPYLRYQSYKLLKEKGITKFYSVSEYFNKSTIKFKRKLNAQHLRLYLSVVFFKSIRFNLLLKTIKQQ